jgi:hypothetical protein
MRSTSSLSSRKRLLVEFEEQVGPAPEELLAQ